MNMPPTPNLPLTDSFPTSEPTYRDRSTGLIVFGIIQIILGALCALLVPLALLGLVMSRNVSGVRSPVGGQALILLVYLGLAIVLITLGVGSIQARRWAHALSLILSYAWLISGSFVIILLTAMLPAFTKIGMRQGPGNAAPIGFMAVFLTVMIVFMAIFLVILPIIFLIFYSKNDVRETCRHRDPIERWTDRAPLPVVAASLFFAFGVCTYLVTGISKPLLPFFGIYLVGIPGRISFLILAIIEAYLARAIFKLQLSAWWVAISVRTLLAISMAITYVYADLMGAYIKMGLPTEEIRIIQSNPMIRSHVILWFGFGMSLGYLGYLIWLKKYFRSADSQQEPTYNPITV